ncbi:MAG: polysaccharide ABC transporter ATP-binding protein, partial [Dehalococcoidia bacterium]
PSRQDSHIWAIKDVSFEVHWGDVLGIIGHNGAGKTTMLKILSRITEPTEGYAEVYGRVGSLLEVGTGFHPELTGRENVYLNGAILGMRKSEIDRKFDEIVEFSEISKFIDTPMKRYSSGMQVRLAFSIAAHLEPEILLTDEVLAVGDANFQRKCLGKMRDVAQSGRTVLFVSHNMSAIERLCNRAIVLNDGQVVLDGSARDAVQAYLGEGLSRREERVWEDLAQAPGDDVVRLVSVRCKDQYGEIRSLYDVREPVEIEFEYAVLKEGHQLCSCLELVNAMGQPIIVSFDNYVEDTWGGQDPYSVGSFRATCLLPSDFLNDGAIQVNLRIFTPPDLPNDAPHVREIDILRITVVDEMDPAGVRGTFPQAWGAAVRPRLCWRMERMPS